MDGFISWKALWTNGWLNRGVFPHYFWFNTHIPRSDTRWTKYDPKPWRNDWTRKPTWDLWHVMLWDGLISDLWDVRVTTLERKQLWYNWGVRVTKFSQGLWLFLSIFGYVAGSSVGLTASTPGNELQCSHQFLWESWALADGCFPIQ